MMVPVRGSQDAKGGEIVMCLAKEQVGDQLALVGTKGSRGSLVASLRCRLSVPNAQKGSDPYILITLDGSLPEMALFESNPEFSKP